MSGEVIGLSLIVLTIFLGIGMAIRIITPAIQKIFLPSSIIAGLLMLLLGPEVLGKLSDRYIGEGVPTSGGIFKKEMVEVWSDLPGLLINIVFACLFLGKEIPSFRKMWKTAGPQISFAHMVAWGQYVFGILLAYFVLAPFFGLPHLAGALLEIGFLGGHGTSAGLSDTFADLGFEEGKDIALGLATIGVISGVVIGIIAINWGARKGKTNILENPHDISKSKLTGLVKKENREKAGELPVRTTLIEALTLHTAFIGLAILIGYAILEAFVFLEKLTWGEWTNTYIVKYVPIFPIAMFGGVLIQLVLGKFDRFGILDSKLINRIQGLSLDLLIASAIASLSLSVIGNYLIPFLLLSFTGIAWNLIAFMLIAPKIMPDYWFERGIGCLGQSMGMTATGLLLIQIVDPEKESPAMEGFGYTQLYFEPFVGGGLFTAVSMSLIAGVGAWPFFFITLALFLAWGATGIFFFGKKKK
jgi:ESS family glutamate:Na+ symporter